MLIENNWLNMLVDKGENKDYVIRANQVWSGNRIPGHLSIVFIEGDNLFHGATAHSCQGLLVVEASRSHSDTPHSVGLFWTSDQPDTETATYTTHNTHKRQTCMPPAGFKAAIPARERSQTHALDCAATAIGTVHGDANMNNSGGRKQIYPSNGLRASCFSLGRKQIWCWSHRLTVDENWHPRAVRFKSSISSKNCIIVKGILSLCGSPRNAHKPHIRTLYIATHKPAVVRRFRTFDNQLTDMHANEQVSLRSVAISVYTRVFDNAIIRICYCILPLWVENGKIKVLNPG